MFLAMDVELGEIAAANAAHQHARGVERRGRQRLPFDDRHREPDAGHLGDAVGDRLEIGQRRFQRLHKQMAVEAEDLVEQFLAEAVHHRHDDDEGRNAEHDAEEREPGDDRDESLFAPRPQVAQRQHPFERCEGPCPGRFAHRWLLCRDFIRFWRFQASIGRTRVEHTETHGFSASAGRGWRRDERFSRLPSARFLISILAGGEPLGTDDNLVRHADQVGGRELGARALVEIVVEHVDALAP